MKKLTILIDMDDTIENFCQTLIDILNEKHGLHITIDNVTEWDLSKAFPTLTKHQIFAPTYTKEFWERVKPLPGAIENVKQLIDDGHDIVIVTASAPESVPLKLNHFLFRHFPFIKRTNVIVCSRKQMVRGDVMIDDAPHNLEGGDYIKIMMSANHNKSYNTDMNGMRRVRNWDEAYQCVRCLSDYLFSDIEELGR